MTYYNSLVGCQLAQFAPLGNLVLEGGPGLPVGLSVAFSAQQGG